jgi:catabolite regulation protein CreA
MKKEKNKSLETMFSIKVALLFKKSFTQRFKDENEDVYNYCK